MESALHPLNNLGQVDNQTVYRYTVLWFKNDCNLKSYNSRPNLISGDLKLFQDFFYTLTNQCLFSMMIDV